MEILANAMVIFTMQYISASNQHVLHKLTQSYISIIAQGVCVWAGGGGGQLLEVSQNTECYMVQVYGVS